MFEEKNVLFCHGNKSGFKIFDKRNYLHQINEPKSNVYNIAEEHTLFQENMKKHVPAYPVQYTADPFIAICCFSLSN